MVNLHASRNAALWAVALSVWAGAASADVASLIQNLSSESPDTRAAAFKAAGPEGAAAVAALGDLAASEDPEVSLAAQHALEAITAYAGGPEGNRAAVAAALADLLGPARSEALRRHVLVQLRLVAAAPEVPAIAALLRDPALADDARMTLESMPGPGATEALITALGDRAVPVRAAIATALGRREAEEGRAALRAAARSAMSGPADVALAEAALKALAQYGDNPGELVTPGPDWPEEWRGRFQKIRVEAALARARNGATTDAEALLSAVLNTTAPAHVAVAALLGLADIASDRLVPEAMKRLGEPGVRLAAVEVLVDSTAPGLDAALRDAYAGSTDVPVRTALLRTLVRRGAADEAFVAAAQADASPEIRIVAAELAGQDAGPEDLYAVALNGSAWMRGAAAERYLAAAATAGGADTAAARLMYTRMAQSPVAPGYRIEALAGLGQAGNAESLALLRAFAALTQLPYAIEGGPDAEIAVVSEADLRGSPDLRRVVEQAYTGIMSRSPADAEAQDRLKTVALNTADYDIARMASSALAQAGIDPAPLARKRGFITDWRLLGTFPNPENSAFGTNFIDPATADGRSTVDYDGRTLTWRPASAPIVPAVINLNAAFDERERVAAYGVALLAVDAATDVVFHVGSNDGCELWVNGTRVVAEGDPRGLTIDQNHAEARLNPGENRVLIKVLQDGSAWEFCVRVTDPEGNPLDLQTAW